MAYKRGSRGEQGGLNHTHFLENDKDLGFFSNHRNNKAIKPVFNAGPSSAY